MENEQIKNDLEAVKQNGYALKYVENQTEEICLEAVKQKGEIKWKKLIKMII